MKHVHEDQDAATRLKDKLRSAMDSLSRKESPALIKHIIHDVAHIASAYGQRSLRQQYQEIIELANDVAGSSNRGRVDYGSDTSCGDCHGGSCSSDWGNSEADSFHHANRDLLHKMNHMKDMIVQMEEQHSSEVEGLRVELARYKELLAESERKLIKERLANQKLRTSKSAHGNFGFGALTVRSCGSRNTSRSRCSPCPTCRSYSQSPTHLQYITPDHCTLSN